MEGVLARQPAEPPAAAKSIESGECVQSDGLLVVIKSGSLWLEKWKPLLQGVPALHCTSSPTNSQNLFLWWRVNVPGRQAREAHEKAHTAVPRDVFVSTTGNRSSPQGSFEIRGHGVDKRDHGVFGGMWLGGQHNNCAFTLIYYHQSHARHIR